MNETTYEKMLQLRLKGMAEAYQEQDKEKEYTQWTFEERLAHLIDRESDVKVNEKIKRLIQNANLSENQAYLEGIKYYSDRDLDKDLIKELGTNKYVTAPNNVLIVGPTGSGKSYLACALGYEACLASYRTRYVRLPDLLTEIALSKAESTFHKLLKRYERFEVLILDEWLLMTLNTNQAAELLEIIERRYRYKATIICSQFSIEGWHTRLGGGAIADAILDRLVSKAKVIRIQGHRSMRDREA